MAEKQAPMQKLNYTTNSGFERSINSIPAGVRELLEQMPDRCANAIPADVLRGLKNVVATGCGDSLCAALAGQAAFEQFTDLRVDTPSCLDLGRSYDVRRFGKKGETLVIVISTSGLVSRCVEAIRRAKRNGAVTLAVTANADCELAKTADYVLDVTLTEFWSDRTPGSRNFVGSALALHLLALEAGIARGTATAEDKADFIAETLRYNKEWEDLIPSLYDRFLKLADDWNDIPYFEALSAGAEFAAAWFTQAKIFEGINLFARYENFEDWAHVDYILRNLNSGIFLYCSEKNPALSRCREIESILDRQHYRYLTVTDADPASFKNPDNVVTIPTSKYLFLHTLFESVVGCIMADCLQRLKGNGYYCSDMIDTMFPFGGAILRTSEIVDVD